MTVAVQTLQPSVPKLSSVLRKIAEAKWFNNFILGLIVTAAVVVGLETKPEIVAQYGTLLHLLDQLILWGFAAEIAIKIGAEGKRPWRYFQDPWNVFDFGIVALCFMPLQSGFASVLRLARIIRALRLVKALPKLRLIVNALLHSLSSIGYVGLLLFIVFYMYAVMGVALFGKNDPVHFGNLSSSFLTLFQVVTLEGWADLMYTQMLGSDNFGYEAWAGVARTSEAHPLAGALYFVSFIMLGTMVVMNLFIGIIINGMTETQEAEAEAKAKEAAAEHRLPSVEDELAAWRRQMDEMQQKFQYIRARMEAEATQATASAG